MTRPQIALVLHALALIGAMVWLVPRLTLAWGGPTGFLSALGVYWLGFCVPVIAFQVWRQRDEHLYSERLAWRDWFVPGALLLGVGIVGLIALVPNTAILTTHAAMLAAIIGIINGTLGESAWRGGFLTAFANRRWLGFVLSWLLFTGFHATLLLSHNLTFAGGPALLVGLAAALGLFWNWLAWRTNSIFWTSIAHVLTNILAFWVLFDGNGFA